MLALASALACGSVGPGTEPAPATTAAAPAATEAAATEPSAIEATAAWPPPPPLDPARLPCFASGVAAGRYEAPPEWELAAVVIDGCVGLAYAGRSELPTADGVFGRMLRASLSGSQRVLGARGDGLEVRSESWPSGGAPAPSGPPVPLVRTGDVPGVELALFDGDRAVRAAAVAAAVRRQSEPRIAALLVRYLAAHATDDDEAPMSLVMVGAIEPSVVRALVDLLPHDAHCREAGARLEVALPPRERAAALVAFVEAALGARSPDTCHGLSQVGESLVPAGATSCSRGERRCLSEPETVALFDTLAELALTRARSDLEVRETLDLARSLVYPTDPDFLRAATGRTSCDEQVRLLTYLAETSANPPEPASLADVYAGPIRGGLCDPGRDEAAVLLATRAASFATEETWQLIWEVVSGPRGAGLHDRIARAIEWPATPPSRCVHGLSDATPTGVRVATTVGLGLCP